MKRLIACLLAVGLLLTAALLPVGAKGLSIPRSWLRKGIFFSRTAGEYSESVRLLSYAFSDVSHVTFGESSSLSRKLAASPQLQALLSGGASEGVVNFYDNSDLEFSIGGAHYELFFETISGVKYAKFVLRDTYDFTEIRDGSNLSQLLNNLGTQWQSQGVITPYDWIAFVRIKTEN